MFLYFIRGFSVLSFITMTYVHENLVRPKNYICVLRNHLKKINRKGPDFSFFSFLYLAI